MGNAGFPARKKSIAADQLPGQVDGAWRFGFGMYAYSFSGGWVFSGGVPADVGIGEALAGKKWNGGGEAYVADEQCAE